MRSLLLSLTLASCVPEYVEDNLGCCWGVGRDEVRECTARSLVSSDCGIWRCPTTEGAVCRLSDGTVVAPAMDFCRLTPDVPLEWCEGGAEHWEDA